MFSALDLRLALRTLARQPLLTLLATLSLAVAITLPAVAVAVFSSMHWPELRVANADRLVMMHDHDRAKGHDLWLSRAEYEHRRATLRSFEEMGAFATPTLDVRIASACPRWSGVRWLPPVHCAHLP